MNRVCTAIQSTLESTQKNKNETVLEKKEVEIVVVAVAASVVEVVW